MDCENLGKSLKLLPLVYLDIIYENISTIEVLGAIINLNSILTGELCKTKVVVRVNQYGGDKEAERGKMSL